MPKVFEMIFFLLAFIHVGFDLVVVVVGKWICEIIFEYIVGATAVDLDGGWWEAKRYGTQEGKWKNLG